MADGASSTITLNEATYTAGDTVTAIVTLKDTQGNLLSGQASVLTSSTVSIQNVIAKSGVTSFTEKGNGVYTREYIASVVSSNKATVTLNGTNSAAFSYSIKVGTANGSHLIIQLDSTSYTAANTILAKVWIKDSQDQRQSG